MKQKSKQGNQQSSKQGAQQGNQGHGGQHSGGLGGEHGGDLHDVGSQSGMGGSESGNRQSADDQPEDELFGADEGLEVKQSAQREGMGRHRHSGRGNEQILDGTIDIDELGTQRSGPGSSR